MRVRIRTSSEALLLCAISLAWLGAVGCANERVYRPAELPPELQASAVTNVQTLDLSRLAGPPINSDRIEREDVIDVSLAAGLSADAVTEIPVRVGEDGTALLPEIGPVQLAGLTLTGAEQAIAAACTQRGFYQHPQVTVTLRQQRTNRITVVGAVKTPGVLELPRGSSYLLAAIVAAGGLDEDAGPKVEIRCPTGGSTLAGPIPPGEQRSGVQLTSGQEPVGKEKVSYVCLNLAESVARGEGTSYLPDGSVITIEKRQPQPYHVIGLVQKPGQFDYPVNHDVRLLEAIAQAGGASQVLADKIYVIRATPNGDEDTVIEVSLKRAKHNREENIRLQPGDIVSVEQTPATMMVEAIRGLPFHVGASVPIF